jgi:PKD repeat protein
MRGPIAAAVVAAALAAAPSALAADTFVFTDGEAYTWDTAPTNGTNHAGVAPGASFHVTGSSSTFTGHPLVWDTGDLGPVSSGTDAAFTAPTRPGFYAFHCTLHGSTGDEGTPGEGMAGYIVVPGDNHATPDFSVSPSPQTGAPVTFTYTGSADPDPGDAITRYVWDLDGNGSYETSTTSGTATKTYATQQSVAVKLKVTDRGHELSDAAVHTVDVAAPKGGPPLPGDTSAPLAKLVRVKARPGKLQVTFSSSEAGSAAAVLRRGGRKLGSGRKAFSASGRHTLTVKLNRRGRKALTQRRRARLALSVADGSGNKTAKTRSLRL